MAAQSSIPAWEISWTEEPGGLRSMGLQRVRHDLATAQQRTDLSSLSGVMLLVSLHSRQRHQSWAAGGTSYTPAGGCQIPLLPSSAAAALRSTQGHAGQKHLLGFVANRRDWKVIGPDDSLRHIHLYPGLRGEALSMFMCGNFRAQLALSRGKTRLYSKICAFPLLCLPLMRKPPLLY